MKEGRIGRECMKVEQQGPGGRWSVMPAVGSLASGWGVNGGQEGGGGLVDLSASQGTRRIMRRGEGEMGAEGGVWVSVLAMFILANSTTITCSSVHHALPLFPLTPTPPFLSLSPSFLPNVQHLPFSLS